MLTRSIRDDPYWTSRKNSLELIELSSINKVSQWRYVQYAFGVGLRYANSPPPPPPCFKIRVQALKIRIQALKIRTKALKMRIQALKMRIQALKIRI